MEDLSSLVVGALVTLLGLVGLVMAAHALDDEILLFGLTLAAFAVFFDIGLIRRYYDRADHARAALRGGEADHV